VIISRADPKFLAKLFELEIPEIYDGIIEIKQIAREPGERAKVAVESHDDRIDAVGACVGMKGVRIHTIVRELNNENIDVINFTDQPSVYIQRALAPAKLKSVEVSRESKTANVVVTVDQFPLAVGRNGQNIRLASKLTGYEINLIKEGGDDEYDIELVDFKPELGEELYLAMIDAELETAKDVLNASMDTLLGIPGLDEKRIREIREMIRRDLEEAEVEDEDTVPEAQPAAPAPVAPASPEAQGSVDGADEHVAADTDQAPSAPPEDQQKTS
jgi:N utilization substance protein A